MISAKKAKSLATQYKSSDLERLSDMIRKCAKNGFFDLTLYRETNNTFIENDNFHIALEYQKELKDLGYNIEMEDTINDENNDYITISWER